MGEEAAKDPALGARIILGAFVLFLLGLLPLVPSPLIPLVLNPQSLVTEIPASLVGNLGNEQHPWILAGAMSGALVAPIAFVLVSRAIIKRGATPSTSIVAFLVAMVLSYAFAIIGWNETARFTSMYRVGALAIQSLIPPVVLIGVFLRNRGRLTVTYAIALHWLGLAWFTWSAFPWWGELL